VSLVDIYILVVVVVLIYWYIYASLLYTGFMIINIFI